MDTKARKLKTATLLNRLFKASDIGEFLSENAAAMSTSGLCELLTELCNRHDISRARVIERSGVDRSYAYQIFSGKRKPSRDKVLMLAFGMSLDVEETQALLKAAQMSQLYPKLKRDAAVLFCLHHQMDIDRAQALLWSLALSPLGEGEL